MLSHPFRSTVEVKREILAIFHILLEALEPHLSQLKYYVSRQITVFSEARSSVLRYRIKFEVDCNVDIIYIRSSVDSIAILISLFVLINRSSVEESNRFKISLEGILCESKKKTVNSLIRFSSKIRCDTKPQESEEFREKQTNGFPSTPRSCGRETFLLND